MVSWVRVRMEHHDRKSSVVDWINSMRKPPTQLMIMETMHYSMLVSLRFYRKSSERVINVKNQQRVIYGIGNLR
jgi:hypothetical protein